MSNFWDFMWLILSTFVFVAYLLILFQIVADLFRDSELGGGSKALWLIGLIFVPMLTALVYVITRGTGMANRQRAAMRALEVGGRVLYPAGGRKVASRADRRCQGLARRRNDQSGRVRQAQGQGTGLITVSSSGHWRK